MPSNEHWFGTSSAGACRDVICNGDLIKFVEVEYHRGDYAEGSDDGAIDYGWKATAWHKILSSHNFADWQHSFTVDTYDITVTDDERCSYLLPEL
uniref:DUF1618 domain-containing protein n=1 Tax=Triticum urartu TaxID=4572 RepID=A0A8R7VE23_TRIUA